MKITLAAIVGNEEAVIERFIESFSPAVDEIVLVRACGHNKATTPDKTIQKAISAGCKVSEYFNKAEFPHVDNFSSARNKAWVEALKTGADYILWADADDMLADGSAAAIRAAAESATHDVFIMPYHVKGDKQVVQRERMVRAGVKSEWKYAIHEQLSFPESATYRIISDAVFIHSPLESKTNSHERNLAILQNELKDTARNLFYVCQEYFQNGKERLFKKYASAALAYPGLEDLERYEILVQLAQTSGTESRKLAAEAFAIMPDRREALALLANYCIVDGDYQKALELAQRVIDTPSPRFSYWSQNNEWYGWKGAELYRQCLRLNGKDEEAEADFNVFAEELKPIISVVHATLGRPEQALAIREMWLSRARYPENVEYIFGLHSFDSRSVKALAGYKHSLTGQKGPGWNYDTAAGLSTGQIIIQAQDDCYPPDGWDVAINELIPNPARPVCVFPNDGHRMDLLAVNVIQTRAYQEIKSSRDPGENGFFHRGYTTVFPDTEHSFRAIEDAKNGITELVDARDFVLYHDHPAFNPAIPWDETYKWENAPENYKSGRELFEKRNPGAHEGSLARKPQMEEEYA